MADSLYSSLVEDREELLNVIDKIDDYHVFRQTIRDIEEKYGDKYNIWQEICMGFHGNKMNKLSAIYEFPTKQLINVLSTLFEIFNIRKIDEVGAGMGLLTTQLQKKFKKDNYDVNIVASDNNASNTTSISLDYVSIRKKAVEDIYFQITKNINPPEAVIMAWTDEIKNKEIIGEFDKLIKTNKIKMFVFIGNIFKKYILSDDFIKTAYDLGYVLIRLPILQISYLDYFYRNELDIKSRSITSILVHKSMVNFDKNTLMNICGIENFYEEQKLNPYSYIFQDSAISKKCPFWLCHLKDENDIKTAKEIFEKNFMNGIPIWIKNMKSLTFWHRQNTLRDFPTNINSEEKLAEYSEYYDKISELGLRRSGLKERNILPEWINNDIEAKQFIWLMFSIPDTYTGGNEWKESKEVFINLYDNTKKNYLTSLIQRLSNINYVPFLSTY